MEELDETYHSTHGALTESIHVYIKMGLEPIKERFADSEIRIFEMGFGTGLNAYLTAFYAEKWKVKVNYHSVEKYPLDRSLYDGLDYNDKSPLSEVKEQNRKIWDAPWGEEEEINPWFRMCKVETDFFFFLKKTNYHLLYFDAFGFRAQSEFWGEVAFRICHELLAAGGILVTYAAKGSARRAMEAVGFEVEKLPGAPGKREMLRANKPE